jgi:hypothetical protein
LAVSVLQRARRPLLLLACAALAIAGAFAAGLLAGGGGSAAADEQTRTFTGRRGDVFRVPAIGVRCVASQEGGSPRLLCRHAPSGRYDVVLFRESLYVYRRGSPDDPVFFGRH